MKKNKPVEIVPLPDEKFVLVKIACDWADEFDVDGFIVTKKDNWEADVLSVKTYFAREDAEQIECYFGTNEAVEFEDFDRFEDGIDEVKELTPEEARLIIDLFAASYQNDHTYCHFGAGAEIYCTCVERAQGNE